ncbi:hypothetical protein HYU14_00815 [Candidatus Woesearchaeota archaeon]|nr:hypothetical protein [Candidatus Woesearchaeota archaeon]
MAPPSLISYIREELRAGYSWQQIRDYLLRYHYPAQAVDGAYQELSRPAAQVKPVNREKAAVAIAIVFVLLLGSGFTVYLIATPGAGPIVLGIKASLSRTSFEPGDAVKVLYSLDNPEKGVLIDTEVKFELFSLRDELIGSGSEKVALKDKFSGEKTLPLSGDALPGSYYVKVSALHPDGKSTSTANFNIESVQEQIRNIAEEQCPATCDDQNKCTRDTCGRETGFSCRHEVIDPCCGDGICSSAENYETCLSDCDAPSNAPPDAEEDAFGEKSIFEKIDIIGDIAKRDYEKAARMCRDIEILTYQNTCFTKAAVQSGKLEGCDPVVDERSKDDCFFDFAIGRLDAKICEKVVKETRRDQCYMEFVTKGDYTVCGKLANRYLKQSCDSLSQLSTFDPGNINASQFNVTALGFETEEEFREYIKNMDFGSSVES